MNTDEKVIDLELGKSLVGGSLEMAYEILQMLSDALPQHKAILIKAVTDQKLENIRTEAHKLHGAACFTGTPRLKTAAKALEQAAKHNQAEEIPALSKNLFDEMAAFEEAYKEMDK